VDLERVHRSMHETCREAGVTVVTGDTKVMGRGELDGLVINTTGVAFTDVVVPDSGLRPGDRLLVTGTIGDHGLALMARRHALELEGDLRSDVAPLNGLVRAALAAAGEELVAMKDPTRGGVAGVLHEMAAKAKVGVVVEEAAVPVRDEVRAACEMVGIDPLLVANEGKAVIAVRPAVADRVLAAIRAHPLGRDASLFATAVAERPGSVILDTGFGRRMLAEPEGELLPRIC
jgi:hydrogenase expression/formation protein HypE